MWVAFAMQKLLAIFQQKILLQLIYEYYKIWRIFD